MPSKGVLIGNFIFLGIITIFLLFAGCKSPPPPPPVILPLEPFTPVIIQEVGKENIHLFQFYISESMTLRRVEDAVGGGVYEDSGIGWIQRVNIRDTINISSNTKGVFESMAEDESTIYISFDEDLNIMFYINYGFGGRYQWLGGTVEYKGHFYSVDFDELNPPILLIEMNRRNLRGGDSREVQGRTIQGRTIVVEPLSPPPNEQ